MNIMKPEERTDEARSVANEDTITSPPEIGRRIFSPGGAPEMLAQDESPGFAIQKEISSRVPEGRLTCSKLRQTLHINAACHDHPVTTRTND